MTGHSLEKAIKNEFSGDIEDGLIAILQCTTNKAEFFASRLHKSMAGIGTNDNQLIRLIVTRCEVDLNDIKVAFERLYGKSLRSWIKGKFSRTKINILIILIENNSSSRGYLGPLQTLFVRSYWRTAFIINEYYHSRTFFFHFCTILIGAMNLLIL